MYSISSNYLVSRQCHTDDHYQTNNNNNIHGSDNSVKFSTGTRDIPYNYNII